MEIEAWLQAAMADAERRGVPELAPLLTALARATEALRRAECDVDRDSESRSPNPDAAADD
jgi:hypothetical protein